MTKYYSIEEVLKLLKSITETAEALKISRQRVQQLIDKGGLQAKKIGSTWVIVSLKRKEN